MFKLACWMLQGLVVAIFATVSIVAILIVLGQRGLIPPLLTAVWWLAWRWGLITLCAWAIAAISEACR